MKKLYSLCCLCFIFSVHIAFAQKTAIPKRVVKSMDAVKPESIKAHIQYLADDRLKGRMPGTEGYQIAVDYVISQYKAMGVEPAGDSGTYLQRVKLRKSLLNTGSSFSLVKSDSTQELVHGVDFNIFPHATLPQASIEAPLVFAGYGISIPEHGYDDYAGLDVKGKIVLIIAGGPAKVASTISAHSQNLNTRLKTAANHGAVGLIICLTNPTLNPATYYNIHRGIYSAISPDGNVLASRGYADQIQLLGVIRMNVFQQLMQDAGKDLTQVVSALFNSTPASSPLNTHVKISYSTAFQDFESYNVAGKITGSDKVLKDEYVVHSAHLDHVGIGTPVEEDYIYNGAHDNASGVASLLEIAGIYTRLKQKPQRSILLLMVTAEEMGLLGSSYFAQLPTVPAQNIVANINTDMPTIIAPLVSAVALGAEHSTLKQPVDIACNHLGIILDSDPEPEQTVFIRSDQYSFVKQKVPSLMIIYGPKTAAGDNGHLNKVREWRAKYYHKPQDDINSPFDFEAGKKYTQLNFLISYLVAQAEQRPQWNPGDFFGEKAAP